MLLWPFNKYPGTDYETFNWEWVLGTVKTYTQKVDDFIENIIDTWDNFRGYITDTWNDFKDWTTGEIDQMHDDFATYVNVTAGALNTGAIANGAITKPKINTAFLQEIENAYVTPEMYGAAGDGVTDDTTAVQAAINSGNNVYLKSAYKITTALTVPKHFTMFGGSPFSLTDASKGIIIASGCDAFHIPAGTRFFYLHDFRIVSDYGGIVFTGSGTITRCVFSNLTMSCKYDITDTFVNGSQVTSAVSLWDIEFNNISSYIEETADKYALYLAPPATSFAIKFRNLVTGDKSLYIANTIADFDNCNFGFAEETKITTTASALLNFDCCNFEDDEISGSATKLDISSTTIIFKKCRFQTRASDTNTAWLVMRSSINGIIFENCEFKVLNGNNNFWLAGANFVERAGAIKFIGYNNSRPGYTNPFQAGTVNKNVGCSATKYASSSEGVEENQFGIYDGQLAFYNGTKWVGPGSKTSYTAPSNPYNGQLWTNGNDLKTYVWYGDAWFDMMGNRYTP